MARPGQRDADAGRVAGATPQQALQPVSALQSDRALQPDPSRDPALDALRAAGAQRMDPARFRYLEALERRSAALPGAALQQRLVRLLADAVATYRVQWDAHCVEAAQLAAQLVLRYPQAAAAVGRLQAGPDLRGLRQLGSRLAAEQRHRNGPLAQLLRHLVGQQQQGGEPIFAAPGTPGHDPAAPAHFAAAVPMPELRTVQRDRDTWARLRLDEQLARSQQQAPDNPGPLNSHLLALRALRAMHELSPAYLSRFAAQVEALMWLDGAKVRPPAAAAGPKAGGRKGVARRSA